MAAPAGETGPSDIGAKNAIIRNIPKHYHSRHLRNYFSEFIETGGFECFHFQRRFEAERETLCCPIKLSDRLDSFRRKYDDKHWIDLAGDSEPTKCRIDAVTLSTEPTVGTSMRRITEETSKRLAAIDSVSSVFGRDEWEFLEEFRPASEIPRGNVGTPTRVFKEMIRNCQLPVKAISRFGLDFSKYTRGKKYSAVPMDYGTTSSRSSRSVEDTLVRTACGDIIPYVYAPKRLYNPPSDEEEEREESDGEEDWERHETLHDDVTEQGRNKERLFEEEEETVWEKGGSGLVFYTDAARWDTGDFDEKTADDLDVDMSVYDGDGVGVDKDAADLAAMRREAELRDGLRASTGIGGGMQGGASGRIKDGRMKIKKELKTEYGRFEKHTRGFGRRVMERFGWTDGAGLGRAGSEGSADPVDTDRHQGPRDKSGFGYHGEQLPRFLTRPEPTRLIGTAYDNNKKTK